MKALHEEMGMTEEEFKKEMESLDKEIREHRENVTVFMDGDDWDSSLEVEKVKINMNIGVSDKPNSMNPLIGSFVSLRAIDSVDPEQKTRVGIYIGSVAIHGFLAHDKRDKSLAVVTHSDNPAFFVPSLSRVVLGVESWWKPVKDVASIQEISDEEIHNSPVIQMLRALAEEKKEQEKID